MRCYFLSSYLLDTSWSFEITIAFRTIIYDINFFGFDTVLLHSEHGKESNIFKFDALRELQIDS